MFETTYLPTGTLDQALLGYWHQADVLSISTNISLMSMIERYRLKATFLYIAGYGVFSSVSTTW